MEEEGLRPIAFAYKQMEEQEITEDGLILLAVVGFGYKIGEETKSTVGDLRNAGLSIKLVSQDEPWKALKIARELGICSRDVVPLEGKQFRDLNPDDAKKEKTDQISVIGRCLPKEKLLMLQRLKQEGDVVAYYGGLTTADTLALKKADVGITEGTLSTEMAREGCDIIVNPGRVLCPLTPLRKYGRCAYHNIQRTSHDDNGTSTSGANGASTTGQEKEATHDHYYVENLCDLGVLPGFCLVDHSV
ncbi:hypothetical protein F0562_008201 [Nyssa sinensis]|uniref:Cation-transporting P-type ATPase C-terminal domain-containing protein n=1 Tax=Nyssa sinensis TaxID=561372 RepID=A0A5J5A9V8_9ASTE|nr:hypothetical protein F0562_008201 [Nyssa sinensis]